MAKEETALGSARARFVEGLPRKAQELRGAVALLSGTPDADRPREELRRRLHALYASAQVFRIDALAGALKEAIGRLDGARTDGRPVTQDDLDALATLSATLPGLAGDDAPAPLPSAPPPEVDAEAPPDPPRPSERPSHRPSSRPRGRGTLRGLGDEEKAQVLELQKLPQLSPARAGGSFTAGRASERPSPRHPTPLSTVLQVLVVDQVEWQTRIMELLPAERFELVAASDPEAALRLARTSGPDVVLLDQDIVEREGSEFISRLHSDPLTDFVPVVLMLPEGTANDLVAVAFEGADETLGKPFDRDTLIRTIARVTGASGGEASPISGSLTAVELADRLADELRRGIAEAAEHGRDVKVPVGDGSALLAAAWSAIARVRAHLARESGGKVRFRDGPRRGGPALMALMDEGGTAEEEDTRDVSLEGRRIIVVDDDPAVVWFFAGLLREEGADVFEAEDGMEALGEARRHRPDVIISDILMPELDGFGLCRALERDPSLSDVPVILLSWKEDFLQRMRDLHAGARGYLRKEAGTAQILARVREVLRPRARLEAQLATGSEVRGRTEGLGVVTLLRCAAKQCPDARIVVRDAWNLFEVDLRGGDLVDLTRTATDGSFARGPRALPQLLGVTSARFTVDRSDGAVMKTFDTPIEQLLADGCAELGAMVDAISGKALPLVERLELDEDALSSFLRTSPAPIEQIVKRLKSGQSPRELLMSGDVAPGNLESALIDLARRGAIRSVRGVDGEDRVARALAARQKGLDVPSEPPIEPPEQYDYAEDVNDDARHEVREDAAPVEKASSAEPTAVDIRPPGNFAEAEEEEAGPVSDPPPLDDPFEREEPGKDDPSEPPPADQEIFPAKRTEEPTLVEPVQTIDDSLLAPAAVPKEARELAQMADAVESRRPEKADDEEAEPSLLGWATMLIIFAGVGFVAMSVFSRNCSPAPDPGTTEAPEAAEGELLLDQEAPDAGAAIGLADARPEELAFGETLPHADGGPNVRVGRDQGLLVIEAGEGPGAEVFIGARSLGRIPIREALDEGRYELRYRRGDEDSYRFVYVRAGQTRVIPPL